MSSPETEDRENSTKEEQAQANRTRKNGPGGPESPSAGQNGSGTRGRGESAPRDSAPSAPLFGWSGRDFMVPYILLALSVERAHGYLIEQYLRNLGIVNVELSTLYRTLRQLEKNGVVYSTWEPGPDGPARRIYSLTDAGRWWLDAGASALAGYRDIIDRFFGSYAGPIAGSDVDDDEKGASR